MSKKYKLGVVGNPIEHSLSPFIHSRFARSENINIEYLPYKVNDIDFDQFIKEFFNDVLSKGLNITLPYKKKAAEIDGDISNEARFINAVNTIAKDNKNVYLHSTDGIGFITDIKEDKSFNFEDTNIFIHRRGRICRKYFVQSRSREASSYFYNESNRRKSRSFNKKVFKHFLYRQCKRLFLQF
jgi:shikimate dehydrogenase